MTPTLLHPETPAVCPSCGCQHSEPACPFCTFCQNVEARSALGDLLRAAYNHTQLVSQDDMTDDSVFADYYDPEAEALTKRRWQGMTDEQYQDACDASDEEAGLRYDATGGRF